MVVDTTYTANRVTTSVTALRPTTKTVWAVDTG